MTSQIARVAASGQESSTAITDEMIDTAHSRPLSELLAELSADTEHGLKSAEAAARLGRFGPNRLAEAPPVPLWRKLLDEFKDLVIWILIVAAIISGLLGEWIDSLAIVAIVVINGLIGFFQKRSAERAIAALMQMSAPMARVVRDGQTTTIPADEIVPGDTVELEAGDLVPADARLVRAFSLAAQEASLTGESVPVDKSPSDDLIQQLPIGDRLNMVYLGTTITAGKGRAVVVATGMATKLGHIAELLEQQEHEPTPLERRLHALGRILIVLCLAIVAVVFAMQWWRHGNFVDAFLLSVSLAVAAVPEGLPAVVTIALALGLRRMARRNALVRKLPSVETLGSVTVICSDKTGTLTRNEMTVRELIVGDVRYVVGGSGYAPTGEFRRASVDQPPGASDASGEPVDASSEPDLGRTLLAAAWCNNAQLVAPGDGRSEWTVIGDPTEGALLVAAHKAGIADLPRDTALVHEVPFDSSRKMMSVVIDDVSAGRMLYAKGAPEVLLPACVAIERGGQAEPLDDVRRQALLDQALEMAGRALRVLALAYRRNPPVDAEQPASDDLERELVFLGLVGMMDPPRQEAKDAVATCRTAGIQPVMITGDHRATALAIGRELGLADAEDRALTGEEVDKLTDAQLTEKVPDVAVYARTSAEHKLRIVRAWRSRGQVVAMTGDGVNDAPAVKTADVGIAMGITGTDVTKEAADIVLVDDNFVSIVGAVEEGRVIFDNIQKVLQFLLSCNFGEIVLVFVASLLGWPAPLLPIQLLWINLVTDGLPALALSIEPAEPDVMRRRPRAPSESILPPQLGLVIIVQGLTVAVASLSAFVIGMILHDSDARCARAITFCVLVFAELLRSFAARSPALTLFGRGLFTNRALIAAVVASGLLQLAVMLLPLAKQVFVIHDLTPADWLVIAVLSLVPVTLLESVKLVRSTWVRLRRT
ncbi:MAG: cation-translocating P-type ATPase [Pirellulales bacterium]|nr:cation-translocating P-type ATPase [Pirellulales bacterium]